MNFNISALNTFRNVNLGGENAIANLNGEGGIRKNKELGNFIGKMFRSSTTEANNNAVRTELLKSLGQAFGLEGMTEANGKVMFSRAFMDKLENILGRDVLKTGDFAIGADGTVSSGKPLTQRRITAIVEKASVYGKTDFSIDAYRQKLESIKQDLGLSGLSSAQIDALNKNANTPKMTKLFIHASKSLEFLAGLEFGKPVVDEKTGQTQYYTYSGDQDRSFIRLNPELSFKLELGDDVSNFKGERFQYRMPGSGPDDYQPLELNFDDQKSGFGLKLFQSLGGEFIHTERAHFDKYGTDIEPLKKYIAQTIQLFVQKMVDVYLECKAEGKVDEFRAHCESPGACMEEKGMRLTKLQGELFVSSAPQGERMDKAEVAELERIANMSVGDKAPPQGGDKLVDGVLDALGQADAKLAESEDWADFREQAKEKLVGKTAQIVEPVMDKARNQYKFVPVMEHGRPLVRPLTAEDLEKIGPACLYNTVNA